MPLNVRVFVQEMCEVTWRRGHTPRLVVDATHKDVLVPEFIKEKFKERLILDLNASYPMDLEFVTEGLRATFSFHAATRCFIPWKRIWIVGNADLKESALIKENMPPSELKRLQDQHEIEGSSPVALELPQTIRTSRGWTPRVIKGGKSN